MNPRSFASNSSSWLQNSSGLAPLRSSACENKPTSTQSISNNPSSKTNRTFLKPRDNLFWSQGFFDSEIKPSTANFFSNEEQRDRKRDPALPAESSASVQSFASKRSSFNYPTKQEVNFALQNSRFCSSQSTEVNKLVLDTLEDESAKHEYPLVSATTVASILANCEDLCACRSSSLDSASRLFQVASIGGADTCDDWSGYQSEKRQNRRRKNSWASDPWSHEPCVEPENCMINELDLVRKESITAHKSQESKGISLGLKENHRLIIIDTRYHYEYVGGHISSSLNISSPLVMRKLFFELRAHLSSEDFVKALLGLEGKEITSSDLDGLVSALESARRSSGSYMHDSVPVFEPGAESLLSERHNFSGETRTKRQVVPVIVFHCEFSSQRGPKMWQFVRKLDRNMNIEDYPRLDFPQIFVLKGGYDQFVKDHAGLCTPIGSYRTMLCKEYRDTLNKEESKKSQEWNQLKALK